MGQRSTQVTYAPATLTNLEDTNSNENSVRFQYRPTEFTYSRSVNWNQAGKGAVREDSPEADFAGGQPITMSLKLLFDTYETQKDVRATTKKLWKMSLIQESLKDKNNGQGRPPKVQFAWGTGTTFVAFITQISERFLLFLNDGTPVRSEVNISFREVVEKKTGTNPTSGGPAGVRIHTVTQGETIDWIAFQEYGDPNAWRALAANNNLEDPTQLRPGQRLLITALR